MATFPAGNPGEWPLDPTSEVGRFRVLAGDTNSEPYDPPEPGFQNYTLWSDAEIEALLTTYPDSQFRAIGFAFLGLASKAALESKNIKDHDLSVSTEKRADHLRLIAQAWFDRADEDDDLTGAGAWFDVVPTGRQSDPRHELAEGYWFGYGL